MNSLVIYDSQFGNTEKVARTIASTLGSKLLNVKNAKQNSLDDISLLVVGSPTQGGRETKVLSEYLKLLPSLKGKDVTAFDTRLAKEKQNFGLKIVMSCIGFAAEKIVKTLLEKDGKLIFHSEGFIVDDTKGPLAEKEIERAKDWAQRLKAKAYIKEHI